MGVASLKRREKKQSARKKTKKQFKRIATVDKMQVVDESMEARQEFAKQLKRVHSLISRVRDLPCCSESARTMIVDIQAACRKLELIESEIVGKHLDICTSKTIDSHCGHNQNKSDRLLN